MANILDVVRGLNQAASNAYDGYKNLDSKIGLRREEGDAIIDSRIVDGFRVRFAGDQMILTYQSEVRLADLHPRNKFEDDIEQRMADIVKFLKKEYKNVTKGPVTLTPLGDADILVQSTSRIRSWVQSSKAYRIGGASDVETIKQASNDSVDANIKKFIELATTKRPSNDKAKKNPDTPEG